MSGKFQSSLWRDWGERPLVHTNQLVLLCIGFELNNGLTRKNSLKLRCPMCPIGVTQVRCRFGAVRGQLLQKILLILSLKTFFPCHFLVATIERIVLLYSCQLQRYTRKTTADTHVHNWVEQCRSFQMQSLNIVEKIVETCWQGMQGQIYDFWTCLQIQMDV